MTVHMRTYGVYTVGNVDIQHVTKFKPCCAAPRDSHVCDYSFGCIAVNVTFGHCMRFVAGIGLRGVSNLAQLVHL